jgi:DNA polymerase III epsilon subunit family exonuclease
MHVVYFPGKANLPKFTKLTDDSEIAIFGNLEDDKFSAGMTLRPKVINLCITKPGFYDIVYSLPVPKNYTKVFPEPYTSTEQENLFVQSTEIKNPYLLENDFVVFDLETTGVNYMNDKIIEIGAVKIVQGKLIETFGTLINPERHIPKDATKVNNITDDDVKDAPTLKEVMPDFFKFCDGCVLVSYVIDFDFGFIDYHGKSLGYAFQNKTDDAFVIAKNKLKGLHNYKLTTVAKHLNIALENAHRAVFDAVATGEVMVKLLENF